MVYLFLATFGLVMGSFVTALVDRLHDGRDWVNGRSECDSCHKTLAARDLVPVFSWLATKGSCRQCSAKISPSYPMTELLTVGLFIFSYYFWPYELGLGIELAGFIVWLLTLVSFVAMSVYDLKWLEIPDKILLPIFGLNLGFILIKATFFSGGSWLLASSLLGLLTVGGFFWLLYQISKGRWIGGGDVKLGFLLGLLAGGIEKGALVIFLASAIGSLVSLPLIFGGKLKPKSVIPFGPMLILACIIVVLFGDSIVDWYKTSVLLIK